MRQPVQVAVYCVRTKHEEREYLLLRRILSGGGYWQCITGGVEGNEDCYAAAIRELQEETNYVPISIELIDYSYNFPVEQQMRKLYAQPVETITEIVFLALVDGRDEPQLDPKEHYKWTWCNYEKALDILYWLGNKESLKHCEQHLLSGKGTRLPNT